MIAGFFRETTSLRKNFPAKVLAREQIDQLNKTRVKLPVEVYSYMLYILFGTFQKYVASLGRAHAALHERQSLTHIVKIENVGSEQNDVASFNVSGFLAIWFFQGSSLIQIIFKIKELFFSDWDHVSLRIVYWFFNLNYYFEKGKFLNFTW